MAHNAYMTPLPTPAEITNFVIRHFSVVDDANNGDLKKRLERLSHGSPLSVDDAMELIEEKLAPLLNTSGAERLKGRIKSSLKDYIAFCQNFDCGAVPAIYVRRILDPLAVALFADYLSQVVWRYGLKTSDIIGQPDEGTATVWRAYMKGQRIGVVAEKFYSARELSDGTWEGNIRGWVDGRGMNVSTILKIATKVDLELGLTLLIAQAYCSYCTFECVEPHKHRVPFVVDEGQIRENIRRLNNHFGALNPGAVTLTNEIMQLVDPRREKQPGDAKSASERIAQLETILDGQDRAAGLGFFAGLHQAQVGNLKLSLAQFDRAAMWFKFRSIVQLKICLHHLFNISSALGEKRVANRWSGWTEALGLDISPSQGKVAFLRDFPYPFVEASNWPEISETDLGAVLLSDWVERPVDLRHPDRLVKGYGRTPSPQLHIFSHFGSVEKVQALLAAGADPNKLDPSNGSALMNAIQGGGDDCVRALLEVTCADVVNTPSRKGKSCLQLAIDAGKSIWVDLLLKRGAKVEMRGEGGQTPLYSAASLFMKAEQLLPELIDPKNIRTEIATSPMESFLTNSPFVQNQADRFINSIGSNPAIFEAMTHAMMEQRGSVAEKREIVTTLLDAGADVNALMPRAGFTPFIYAAEVGDEWLFKTLAEHGGNLRQRLDTGHTVYSVLNHYGHYCLAKWLLEDAPIEDRLWLRETMPKTV